MKKIRIMGYLLCIGLIGGLVVQLHTRNRSTILLLGLISFIACVNQIYMELHIYQPLRKSFSRLSREEDAPIHQLFSDVTSHDSYMEQLEQLIERYVDVKIRKNNLEIFNKQTELTALQSQINPHFLYNTLDTIRGQAMVDDNLEIAGMIETLSSFFRYSISRKGTMVTLRDELSNIQNYMRILQFRFRDRFTMEILLDEEDLTAYDFYVPRLILQPIVENAVVHGLEEKMEGGQVVIDITITDDLVITVSDNGKGLTLKELDQLNQRIHSPRFILEQEVPNSNASTGIALPNINKRIVLLYGEKYGLNVYSSIDCGTDVEIVLPIKNQVEDKELEENIIKDQ